MGKRAKLEIPSEILNKFTKPSEYRHLLRLVHIDVRGDIPLYYALTQVKGIGPTLANAIIRVLNLDPNMPVGFLTDEQIKIIENVARDTASLDGSLIDHVTPRQEKIFIILAQI